jgi:hypothetical protein
LVQVVVLEFHFHNLKLVVKVVEKRQNLHHQIHLDLLLFHLVQLENMHPHRRQLQYK